MTSLARRYALDALVVLAMVEAALEVAFRDDPEQPTATLWFSVPAIGRGSHGAHSLTAQRSTEAAKTHGGCKHRSNRTLLHV